MRILVLSKRQYTGKDLLDDQYGRLYEIPAALAARGHNVLGVVLSYRRRPEGWLQSDKCHHLRWHSINATLLGLFRYSFRLEAIARDFHPDLIWACSDAFHAVIGWWLKKRIGRPLVIDLYDNFESYGLTRLPGMTSLLRLACRGADGLSLVSHNLKEYVRAYYGVTTPHIVLFNGVPERLFYPRNRHAARERLGLPSKGRLIGTAGAISAGRGIGDLFKAFLRLAQDDHNLWLVFAGPRDATPTLYRHPRILDLGILPQDCIPDLFSALDVAVVCNRNSAFGRYCFPQKLFEIIACGTPVVAASLGDVARLLGTQPAHLYPPGDSVSLATRIAEQLHRPTLPFLQVPTWSKQSSLLEDFFTRLSY